MKSVDGRCRELNAVFKTCADSFNYFHQKRKCIIFYRVQPELWEERNTDQNMRLLSIWFTEEKQGPWFRTNSSNTSIAAPAVAKLFSAHDFLHMNIKGRLSPFNVPQYEAQTMMHVHPIILDTCAGTGNTLDVHSPGENKSLVLSLSRKISLPTACDLLIPAGEWLCRSWGNAIL